MKTISKVKAVRVSNAKGRSQSGTRSAQGPDDTRSGDAATLRAPRVSSPEKETGGVQTGAAAAAMREFAGYQRDFAERTILFWDTLRQRANSMLEHERAGLPPLLDFKYETLLDARRFRRPVNYALLRITESGEDCWNDCVDLGKPPVIVFDPRAGHGPGIGGFKRDSEVGMAMREGHPVYFVIFFPEPVPGQSLADVLHALRRFVEDVARRHPGKPPVLYGNCQAGWAVTLLSADCQGMVGPAVLNGSPLSYWAGESGVNPMRVSGGLLGGAWLTHLVADLTNPHVGHLGIFVSASVARLEHRAILESLEDIEALPPGLYEMKIDHSSGDPGATSRRTRCASNHARSRTSRQTIRVRHSSA